MRRVLLLLALSGALATPAADAAAPADPFARYVAGMSWPLQASLARAQSAGAAIEGWLMHGDAPYLGQVGAACRKLRAVEATGRRLHIGAILRIEPIPDLAKEHGSLVSAYAQARDGCTSARRAALAARQAIDTAAGHLSRKTKRRVAAATATARTTLRRFERGELRRFKAAVALWRTAVLSHARVVGVAAPSWVRHLRVEP